MIIPFWKMHGAGNDFLLVNNLKGDFPILDTPWVKKISHRKTGVGCEGVILIETSEIADFRMRFINPDGHEVEMCGNGARCIARLAIDLGIGPKEMTIETQAGPLKAKVTQKSVCLQMTDPTDWKIGKSLQVDAQPFDYSYVNSGVPHVVVEVEALENFDVQFVGAKIRHHQNFLPMGTNVDFIEVTGRHTLDVRTYERGVEAETLACGTGIVASGLVAGKLGKVMPPLRIRCASGDVLDVDYDTTKNSAENVKLTGPAEYVFKGELDYEKNL